jgi:leucyl-tRNA synthetase
MSIASPDKDTQWNNEGIEGSFRFIKKVINYIEDVKKGKSSAIIENKINKAIKEISDDIENFRYNLAIIKLRALLETIEKGNEIARKDLESFLKLLSPICPHITEELWHNLGNKTFISVEKWPICDESKINLELDKQEQQSEQLLADINNILKIIREKGGKTSKIYLYCLPKELNNYNAKQLEDKLNIQVEIYSVSDKTKYDPQGKASKAKPCKPAIYVE